MKKTLLLAAIACMTCNVANAQSLVVSSDKGISVVSKAFTSTGKPMLTLTDYRGENGQKTFTLYNADLTVSKTININLPSYRYYSYSETTMVEPNDSSVVLIDHSGGRSYDFSDVDVSNISSSAELIAAFATQFSLSSEALEPYTDSDGHIGFVWPSYLGVQYTYYDYNSYGTKYPTTYYAIVNGQIWECNNYYGTQYEYPIPYTLDEDGDRVYSPEGLTWTREEWSGQDETYYGYLSSIYYADYDNAEGEGLDAYITQTLFNNDSKWEYLVPVFEEYTEYGNPRTYTGGYYDKERNEYINDYTNLYFRRSVIHSVHTVGCKVVNEDGNTLMTFKSQRANCTSFWMENLFLLGGKKYITAREEWEEDGERQILQTLYLFDTFTTSVQEISSVKGRAPMAIVSGDNIDVTLSDADTNSDLILSNMAGQVVGQKHVAAGETRSHMNAAGMPKGLYNLTLRRHGHVLNNQKLMVK